MFWGKKKVKAVFIDADTGEPFARTEMPPDQLPATFGVRTTLHLAGEDWEVVSAEPATRPEYVKRGELVLRLRRLTRRTISPTDLLFSLPTICDGIPPVAAGTTKLGRRVLDLHEDDWRQVEFVARAQAATVREEMVKIERILREERVDVGFRAVHVREAPAVPLELVELSLTDLQAAVSPAAGPYDGVAYRGADSLIEGGFALGVSGGLCLYGLEDRGGVTVLAVQLPTPPQGEPASLVKLMERHDLLLVDWCRIRIISPEQVGAYLVPLAGG